MYDTNLQKLYLGVMLSDGDLLTKVKSITKPSLFSRELQKVVSEVMNYVDEYDGIPDPTYVQTKTNVEIKVPNKVDESIREWFMDEYPKFCLHKALEEAVIKSTELIESEDYDGVEELIKRAQETRLVRDYGLDYSENPKERLQAIKDRSGNISTGFYTLDDVVGKLNIGDLIIYAGGPGSGKSLFLQNNSLHHYSVEGKNVMYITLELNADLCAQRIDSMLLEQPTKRLYENLDATDQVIRKKTRQFESEKGGMLKIKQMPSGSTTNDVKSFVKDFMVTTGNKIDVLVIDYLDLLNPAQKVQLGDVFQKDKAVSEEIRNIAQELQLVSITASQLNRCLTLDTEIEVKNKGKTQLKDINIGDEILSNSGYNKVTAKTKPNKQMVYKIKTASGKEVYASGNHVFPTMDGEKTINTGLNVGDVFISKK